MLVYTPQITNRVQYIFEFVFQELMGVKLDLISDMDDFISYHGIKLNYSKRAIGEELFIKSSDLLLEKGINIPELKKTEFQGFQVPFETADETSIFPFDPFAAAFFFISRYEEYLPFLRDEHERYPAKHSYAFKNGFLDEPVIDQWVKYLGEKIQERFPDFKVGQRLFKFIPSYDIDLAWSYKNKGWIRNIGGLLKSVQKFQTKSIVERISVLSGNKRDPFDTYQMQFDIHKEHELDPLYFILLGEYGSYDRNISTTSLQFHDLIQDLADEAHVGIHPSYRSNSLVAPMKKETKLLASIIKEDIGRSRQHFLRLKIPTTYQALIDIEIFKDYSMGYPDAVGFRASTASSFLFYDLSQEVLTPLRIHPFSVMDYTLQQYLKLQPAAAEAVVQKLIQKTKEVRGLFIPIWHNHTLSETGAWEGWTRVYQSLVKEAVT